MSIWEELNASRRIKRSPRKTIVLIGGSTKSQNTVIKSLQNQFNNENVIANDFHLGYTFIQFKDDSEEVLSTLDIYSLAGPFNTDHKSTLVELFKSSSHISKKNCLFVNLLDYSQDPNSWLKDISSWYQTISEITMDLWDTENFEFLLLVTNQQSKIEWDQDVHEFIQLSLRVICLKYHGSLLYISTKNFPTLIEIISTLLYLPIRSGDKPSTIKSDFLNFSELLVLKDTDSIGKIATLNDKLDLEKVVNDWVLASEFSNLIISYESIVPLSAKPTEKVSTKQVIPAEKINSRSYQAFLKELYEERYQSENRVLKHFNNIHD